MTVVSLRPNVARPSFMARSVCSVQVGCCSKSASWPVPTRLRDAPSYNLQAGVAYARRIGSTWETQRWAPLTQRYWEAMKLPEGLDDRSAMQRANLGPSAPLNEARVSLQGVGPALGWIG